MITTYQLISELVTLGGEGSYFLRMRSRCKEGREDA